ncbi:MAG: MBL fold metallo-hydrolase [Methanomassiliicoccaceae archaeon]|nr:MBL fold metallo-hydrolase [Methanomassiliicoccaceae archaeon]
MIARVTCVYDEGAVVGTPLIGARGLSMLVDADGERTLFDTGMRGRYLMHNLDILETDVNTIDRVVISHAHIAHAGGLEAFLERRERNVDVIVTQDLKDMGPAKLLGIPVGKAPLSKMSSETIGKANLIESNARTQLSEHLFITDIPNASSDAGVKENALVLMTAKGAVVICGCCHGGLTQFLSYIEDITKKKVRAVIGGTHMMKMKKDEVFATADSLKDGHGTPMLYLNHCSGVKQVTNLRVKLGLNGVHDFYAGSVAEFEI